MNAAAFILHAMLPFALLMAVALNVNAETEFVCPTEENDNAFVQQFPSDRDCSVFYKCNRGKAILNKCPDGLHYNRFNQACDFPVRAKCPLVNII